MVYVHSGDRNPVKCRALLDTGSTANFISESVITRLGIQADAHSLPISGINATSSESKGIVHITIRSIRGDFARNLTCLTITTITDFIPFDVFPRELIQIPSNIKLADPDFHIPRPVNLLIGSGSTLSLLSVGQINLSKENQDLFLQKTRLGWVLAGSTTLNDSPKSFLCGLTSLESQIAKFWTIEEITTIKPKSEEEIKCEAHFVKNTIRDKTGRYGSFTIP
ncbi:PREDICTED: uncharacterized protein LOC105570980 [Vollenhovia emeryi]|uniref:uncharacterized protein LOC105570980 n=1 Tax=Vollenhovia emeryi TaxID=411798 RepID=UPI0005F36ABC|nr:PREDICTED: uncharacterized protein LOC105570980 [Vollenhovia emeryi]